MALGLVTVGTSSSLVRTSTSVLGSGELVPERIHPSETRATPWLKVSGSCCSESSVAVWVGPATVAMPSNAAASRTPHMRPTVPVGGRRVTGRWRIDERKGKGNSPLMVRRFVAVVFAVAVVAGLVAPVAGAADPPPSGGQIVDGCRDQQDGVPAAPDVVTPGPAACRNVAQFDWGLARACRTIAASSPEQCQAVDGRAISPADLTAYQSSWVHRALTLQRGIDLPAPLYESLLPHTHNTFNSSAYSPTLTNNDPNQVYSITDQLNMDIRLIEMDLHWVPSIYSNADTGGYWVTLCHGDSGNPLGVHIGCTNDRPFQDGLAEVKAWLDQHTDQFVIVYLENQLSGDASAHALAAKLIDDAVGGAHGVIEKPSTRCAPMDWSRS